MPCVKSFCGKSLATGAAFAAVYTMLMTLPMVALGYLHFKNIIDADKLRGREDKYSHLFGSYEKDEEYEKLRKFTLQTGVSYIAFGVMFFIMAIFLCIGSSNKNPRYLWPWIVVVGIGIGYLFVRILYHGFIDPILPISEPIIGLILILIELYFYIVVYSFKQECVDELVAAFQQAYNQPVIIQSQQYTLVPTTTDAKDLPPSYAVSAAQLPAYPPAQYPAYPPAQHPAYPPAPSQFSSNLPPPTYPSPISTNQYGGYLYNPSASPEYAPSAPPTTSD